MHYPAAGVGELCSLELTQTGSFGSIFEKSPFVLESGYIDRLRICLKNRDGKDPHIAIDGVEFTLTLRGMLCVAILLNLVVGTRVHEQT